MLRVVCESSSSTRPVGRRSGKPLYIMVQKNRVAKSGATNMQKMSSGRRLNTPTSRFAMRQTNRHLWAKWNDMIAGVRATISWVGGKRKTTVGTEGFRGD